jgi:hypothetical protein
MNNIELLRYSISHQETLLDGNYMFVEIHADLEKYSQQTKEIKNTLITLKEIQKQKSKESVKVANSLYGKLSALLKKHAQFSEFGCFINACDATVELASKNTKILRQITSLYIAKRNLNEIVPSEWIQALIDKTSSRKKGQAGEEKLISILKKKGYKYTEDFKSFFQTKKSVSKFKGDFSLKNLNKNLKMEIGKDSQNKKLDLCIKNDKELYFLEAKHISISGGAQNKQIKELIDIIKKRPNRKDSHFVSFLDGIYFNLLFEQKKAAAAKQVLLLEEDGEEKDSVREVVNKLQNQKVDIEQALKTIYQNYFINTAGFIKLFS